MASSRPSPDDVFARAKAVVLMPVTPANATALLNVSDKIYDELVDVPGSAADEADGAKLVRSVLFVTGPLELFRARCRELAGAPLGLKAVGLPKTVGVVGASAGAGASTSAAAAIAAAVGAAAGGAEDGVEDVFEDGDKGATSMHDGADDNDGAGGGGGGGGGGGASSRKRARLSRSPEDLARDRFDALAAKYPWVLTTGTLPHVRGSAPVTYREHYVATGEIFCSMCKGGKPIAVGSSTGNAAQHTTSTSHKQAVSAVGTPGGPNPFASASMSRKVRTTDQEAARTLAEANLRALSHALVIGSGTNPSQLVKLFNSRDLIADCAYALRNTSHCMGGSETTVARDAVTAEGLLDKRLAQMLKGEYYAVGQDGSTFKREKAIVIIVHCAKYPYPFMLDVVFPEDSDEYKQEPTYDFVKAAADINAATAKLGLLRLNCTGLVSDNTSSTTTLAHELNLPLIKCGPHIFNLTALGLDNFKLFKPLVQGLSKLIYLGGSPKRAFELKQKGLSPRNMLVYNGRFGTHVRAAMYLLEHFDLIKEWVLGSELNQKGAGAVGAAVKPVVVDEDDVDEMERFEAEDGDSKEAANIKLMDRVKHAWANKMAKPTLFMIKSMFEGQEEIIKDLSGEGDHVPADVLVKVERFRKSFEINSAQPKCVLNPALANSNVQLTPSEHAEYLRAVTAVAGVANAKLDKHCPKWLKYLEYRFRYTPSNEPQPLPKHTPDDIKPFLGCFEEDFGAKVQVQYDEYVADIQKRRQADEDKPDEERESLRIKAYSYWEGKKASWPLLSNVAKWYLNFPTGNISAERGCAELRGIEAEWQRNRMAHETIRREIKFVYNRRVLEEMTTSELGRLHTL